jgi:proline dehydrogenase|tara:strand:- start:3060 stop:3890 length:831 start_codon:yes stop_codon:yes gene_type:complete
LRILFPFAKRFIAGMDIHDSSVVFQDHLNQNYTVIANLVGENTQSLKAIESNFTEYENLLKRFTDEAFTISVKLTSIGMDHSYEEVIKNLTKLAQLAMINNQMIRLDMEDSTYTQKTIEACKFIHNEFEGSVGITLQANLYRTETDLMNLISNGISIRLVKGAYIENDEIAYTDSENIRQKFLEHANQLIRDNDVKHSIATHDEALLAEIALQNEMMNHRFEFLFGVRRDLQKAFSASHNVGIYMPYGKEWMSYTVRRLKEFKNIRFVAKNLIKEK